MESFGTWIVGLVVAAMVSLAARKVYKDRKSGAGCGCGCDGCSSNRCPSVKNHQKSA